MAEEDLQALRALLDQARAADAAQGAAPAGNPLAGVEGYQPAAEPPPRQKPYKGQIIPFSVDERGEASFDPGAGILGMVKAPFDWAYGVRTGQIPADVRNPEYIGGAANAALTYGPGAAASRAGAGGVRAPSVEALDTAAGQGFENYRKSLQIYPADEYRALLRDTAKGLEQGGYHDVAGGAAVPHRILQREMDRTKNAPFVTSEDLDALRTQLQAKGLKGQDLAGTMAARDQLFNYIEKNLPEGSDRSIYDAVGNYRQARHSEVVTGKDEARAGLNIAKAQGPGLTAEQQRTDIAQLLNSRSALRGFSDTERGILTAARNATPAIDRAQRVGDALNFRTVAGAGAAGALAPLVAGSVAGSPVGAAVAAGAAGGAGYAARSYANRGARRMAEEADNAIRAQSPLYADQFATAPSNFNANPSPLLNYGLADAVAERARERKQLPQTYRVRPDGTVEEFM